MEEGLKASADAIRQFYSNHSRLMESMIPAVEAVERLAAAESSTGIDSGSRTKITSIDAPQEYSTLPTVNSAGTAIHYLENAVNDLWESYHMKKQIPKSYNVRPITDRLHHLLSLCDLHDQNSLLNRCVETLVSISMYTKSRLEATFARSRAILCLANRRPVQSEPLFTQLEVLYDELQFSDEDVDDWPEYKLIVVKLAHILGFVTLRATSGNFEMVFEQLSALEAKHQTFLRSKMKDAVLTRAVLLQAKILVQMKLGSVGSASKESPLDSSLMLRRLGYSLVRFHFDRINNAPQPKKNDKERHQNEAWIAVSILMWGCFWTCWTHIFVGANRESRCYLREFMKFSQTYYLPHRVYQCLFLQSHLDLFGQMMNYREVRLLQMKHVLQSTEKLPLNIALDSEDATSAESEDSFLHCRNDSPVQYRDEHRPDEIATSRTTASPTLERSTTANDHGDNLFHYEEERLPWIRSTRKILSDTTFYSTVLSSQCILSKQNAESIKERSEENSPNVDADVSQIISMVRDLKTPSANEMIDNDIVPDAPKKNVDVAKDVLSPRKSRHRPKRNCKSKKTSELFDEAGIARMCAQMKSKKSSIGVRSKRVLNDTTNELETPVGQEKEDEKEFCPTARYRSRNIRIAHRRELQRSVQASERARHCRRENDIASAVLPLVPDGMPVLDKITKSIPLETLKELENCYRELRWFPPIELFRGVCQRLGVYCLALNDPYTASYYFLQANFIAMNQTYLANLMQKMRHESGSNKWDNALSDCLNTYSDLQSWQTMVNRLPKDWTIIQMSCIDEDSGHLVVTRIRGNEETCSRWCPGFNETGSAFITEFDALMQENMDTMSIESKKEWWDCRHKLNDSISDWTTRCRKSWFSPGLLQWMLEGSGPVILLLDRRLNSLPIELILQPQPQRIFTRMTNLAIVMSHLSLSKNTIKSGVDIGNAYYVLNPDRDLDETQTSMQPIFDACGWTGLIGKQPKEEDLLRALATYDLLVYCGHGSGTKYLHLQALQNSVSKAVALLVGCSSGKLYREGNFEPNGNILSHIVAGSPCVLSLLWDVTDKDIDRYFKNLLQEWQKEEADAFGILARRCRMACKLEYLVGCAVILYGLPVDKKRVIE